MPGMAKGTPDTIAAKWATRLSGATQDVANGVARVQTSPGQLAAQSADLWAQRVADSKPKWQRRVGSVTLQEWQQAMTQKGIPRIAQGAQAAQPKMQAFMAEFLPFVERVQSQVHAMPKNSLEARIQRAVTNMRELSKFQRGAGGTMVSAPIRP